MSYAAFLESKRQLGGRHGFAPLWTPDFLFDFQSSLVDWATWKGRAALFCDCGMGKTPMQLVWAQNVVQHTNRPVLIVAPLAASTQTVREAAKFGIDCERSSTGQHADGARIIVTNYERLHLFDASRYAGMVCDESSILKNFDGVTKATVTEFMRLLPYRLLCTATAAPNDYIELGTSSEALGEMGHVDMLGRFFKNDESSLAPMSSGTKWRFKPHAERPFWQWMCSWARAARKPSDVGPFSDDRMRLPALHERIVTVEASRPMPGHLFVTAARTLPEQRLERRSTLKERCESVQVAADGADKFVAWCHLNDEADLLAKIIPGAKQVSGSDSDERKLELFDAFTTGQLRVLITKPKIGAFGLNWQHCANLSVFPSHSYEQYYQAVRRCWRYGQTRDVTVHVITTQGEADVLGNLQRKATAADAMFAVMAEEMRNATHARD
jgi:hypothetical protein